MTMYPCADCGAPYEQARRRATPFCPDCRRTRSKAKQADRDRERNARRVRENVSDVLDDYVRQGMEPDYVDMMRARLEDNLDDVVPDDMRSHPEPPLTGANTPAGPEDGTSTYFTDLADELDAHSNIVAGHSWWTGNPNWWVGMHSDQPVPDTAYLSAA